MSKRYGSIEERFEEYVIRNEGGACWGWRGRSDTDGYGRLRIAGRKVRAHRLSYELHCEPIPDGMIVRHSCDNPICTNPAHLEVGTQRDNVADKVARNRQARGKDLPACKLTPESVVAIRSLERPHREIAKLFGVSHNLIGRIKRNLRWRHV